MFCLLASVLGPAIARATCIAGPFGYALWPKPDATDAPIDTPIVIARYFLGGDTNVISSSLASADGTAVPLKESNRLPPPWNGCGAAELLFLRPVQKLKAGATYTLTIVNDGTTPPSKYSFTVGDRVTVPEPAVQPQITYLKVFTTGALDYANILVDLGQPPSQLLWLRLKGSYPLQNTNGWAFYPKGYSDYTDQHEQSLPSIQLSVPLASDDNCVDIQIYGVEGRPLFEQHRCQPDRCAVYAIVAATNSAGTPGGSPVDVKQIADGTCDNPPVLPSGPGPIVYPNAAGTDAGALDEDAGAAPSDAGAATPMAAGRKAAAFNSKDTQASCSVSSIGAARSARGLLLMLLLVALRIRSRRRLLETRS